MSPSHVLAPSAPELEETKSAAGLIDSAVRTLDIEADAIASLSDAVTGTMREAFLQAIETIQNTTGRVVVTGMGKSGHIARKIAATFASTGTPSHFVHPGEASHGDLGMIADGDTVIAISNSGETTELSDILTHCKRFSIPLISITSRATSTLGRHGDILLLLPEAPEACPFGMAPTTSTTLALALGDAMAVALMESRSFSQQSYGVLHPGGKLGKLLLKTRDLMHKNDALPLVTSGTKLPAALIEMSNKQLGIVCVVDDNGKLIGAFTGADLRRAVEQELNLSTIAVDKVMNPTPKSMLPDKLAAEAAGYMNELKLTQLIIVEDDKPQGIIHIRDLFRAGIA